MKRITCNSCKKHWLLDDNDVHFQKNCPFCGISTVKQLDLRSISVQSFQEAVLLALQTLGDDILFNPTRLSGFIMDIEPKYSKELRIFKRVIANEYSSNINEMYGKDSNELNILISKYRQNLVENEGLSNEWLNLICTTLSYVLLNKDSTLIQELDGVTLENIDECTASDKVESIDSSVFWKSFHALSDAPDWAKNDLINAITNFKDNGTTIKEIGTDKTKIIPKSEIINQIIFKQYCAVINELAMLHYTNKKYKEAWKLFVKTADEQGDSEGAYCVAYFFENGIHVKKDIKAAKRYYKKCGAIKELERLKNSK